MIKATENFIKNNINLINQNAWEELYNKISDGSKIIFTPAQVSDFTITILQCGINPLEYLDYIPSYYLCRVDETQKGKEIIKQFSIPNNIKEINAYAFKENWVLEKLTIPKSVDYINRDAFTDCENLKEIDYLGTIEDWGGVGEEPYTFYNIGTDIIHCTDGDYSISTGDRVL